MAEIYFDTRVGELLVGSAAIEERLPQSSPGDVVPLVELLTADTVPFGPNDYEKQLSNKWSRERVVEVARWAVTVLSNEANPAPKLLRKHMDRLYLLGLGPEMRLQPDIRSMGELRNEIGLPRGKDNGYYDNWSLRDYARYAQSLYIQLGRKPEEPDYINADGPGLFLIRKRTGGVPALNELIGFVNPRTMDKDDFLAWGARVIRANGPTGLSREGVKALSSLGKGPSEWPLRRWFGSLTNFQLMATEKFLEQEQEKAAERQAKINQYQGMIEAGELPVHLRIATEDELLEFGGRYALAKHLFRKRLDAKEVAIAIASNYNAPLSKQVRIHGSPHRAAEIETQAVILGVFDDIWPMTERDEALKVA